jgi:ABC-type Fe3+ transport system substrate-binding protein
MRALVALISALLIAGGQAAGQTAPEAVATFGAPPPSRSLLVRGTTDIAAFAQVLEQFVASEPGVLITYEQWASNDLYDRAAQACATGRGVADLIISSSVDQIVKLVNIGCARAHRSAETASLPPNLRWRDEVFGITREPAVIVYNRSLVPPSDAPRNRFDLIDLLRPAESPYAGRVATYDIEASGLGYLFAFVDSQQATTFGSLIEAFGRSGAIATCCSAEIIDGVATGEYMIAYNVLASYALSRAAENPDLVIVAPQDYTLVLSRAAMIPKSAQNAQDGAALIDFLLSGPGRVALKDSNLIIESLTEDDDLVIRQIPLSPVLLLGLDQEKRARFLDRWHATFPVR